MSGSLLEIKKKIKGVQNTRKITKAMQLVAASKMRYFQKQAIHSREFVQDLLEVLQVNLNEFSEDNYSQTRSSGKTLFVLYTSDKGLCGPLNNKLINGLFRSNKWNDLASDERALITIGKKAKIYTDNNNLSVEKAYDGITEKITALEAIDIVEDILKLWNKGDLKEVIFVAPHYKNSFTFYPTLKTLLPFSQESLNESLGLNEGLEEGEESKRKEKHFQGFMLHEPSPEEVLKSLYEQIIQSAFIQSFLELKAAEYSSRMIAMQNATDAADKMTSELKLTFNKARQQAITQEIAELIGASMALEDSK